MAVGPAFDSASGLVGNLVTIQDGPRDDLERR